MVSAPDYVTCHVQIAEKDHCSSNPGSNPCSKFRYPHIYIRTTYFFRGHKRASRMTLRKQEDAYQLELR